MRAKWGGATGPPAQSLFMRFLPHGTARRGPPTQGGRGREAGARRGVGGMMGGRGARWRIPEKERGVGSGEWRSGWRPWHGRARTVQPVAGGRVRGGGALLLAGRLPWRSLRAAAARRGKSREKAGGGGMGRKRKAGKEMLRRAACRIRGLEARIGLAARHGRVLLQLPGFAVPAPTLWRPGGLPRGPVWPRVQDLALMVRGGLDLQVSSVSSLDYCTPGFFTLLGRGTRTRSRSLLVPFDVFVAYSQTLLGSFYRGSGST